ncbi:hypothetical protein [Streptomyces sp. NPDC088350]|uniref:hypothetical protein n=1 Tax=Streptomyces sp. NPDC088350 TaxID=3365854 RepID=UPI00380CA60E
MNGERPLTIDMAGPQLRYLSWHTKTVTGYGTLAQQTTTPPPRRVAGHPAGDVPHGRR